MLPLFNVKDEMILSSSEKFTIKMGTVYYKWTRTVKYKESENDAILGKAFVPSEDSVILSGDYSQIELRILAHIADDENMIDAFKHHSDTIYALQMSRSILQHIKTDRII